MKLAYGFLALVMATSCGDEFEEAEEEPRCTGPCNDAPWCCPNGQVCAPDSPSTFSCQNPGPGTLGQPCMLAASPTCAEDLFCYQVTGMAQGICRPFCDPMDPARACPGNAICDPLVLTPPVVIRVCRP